MKAEVKITKNKIFVNMYDELLDYTDDFLKVLMEECTLDEGVTFSDILKLISKEKEILSKLLFPVRFPEYFDYLFKKIDEPVASDDKFSHIEISKLYDFDSDMIGDYWTASTMTHPLTEDEEGFKKGERVRYGFVGADDLDINLPLMIGKPVVSNPLIEQKTFEMYYKPSLLDILYTVFFEISFYGSIEQTKERRKEMFDADLSETVDAETAFKQLFDDVDDK